MCYIKNTVTFDYSFSHGYHDDRTCNISLRCEMNCNAHKESFYLYVNIRWSLIIMNG